MSAVVKEGCLISSRCCVCCVNNCLTTYDVERELISPRTDPHFLGAVDVLVSAFGLAPVPATIKSGSIMKS